jgi:hypothetical protein
MKPRQIENSVINLRPMSPAEEEEPRLRVSEIFNKEKGVFNLSVWKVRENI